MIRNIQKACLTLLLFLAVMPAFGQSESELEAAVERIKDEGLNRSQVMQHLSYLTDVIGPRLTNSPAMKRSNEWTREKLANWGLQNATLHKWGPFGRGWSLERFSMQIVEPYNIPIIAYPKAWTPGYKGNGEVVIVDVKSEEDFAKYRGKLKGAIVLHSLPRELKAHFQPLATRYSDADLVEMATGNRGRRVGGGNAFQMTPEQRAALQMATRKMQFYMEEGVGVVLDIGRGDGGNVFVQSASVTMPAANGRGPAADPQPQGQPGGRAPAPRVWDKNAPKMLPQITVSAEHYNRLYRMLQQGEKLKMQVEMNIKYHNDDLMGYNTIAEIPGTDLKDEVVMLGGHMDSWHAGTGATDNASGCAVAMEAVRIIQSLGLKPRRTIRIALWSGEEQGLFGSRAYVTDTFGKRNPDGTLTKTPAFDKFSAYYNFDNGTGKIRGIYLQGNPALKDIFQGWLKPLEALGATTLAPGNTGSTDHIPFDTLGLPGFQFIQDEVEYSSRTHHSSQDVYDRIQVDDMKQASVVMATFVYRTAMLDKLLPRKQPPTR